MVYPKQRVHMVYPWARGAFIQTEHFGKKKKKNIIFTFPILEAIKNNMTYISGLLKWTVIYKEKAQIAEWK